MVLSFALEAFIQPDCTTLQKEDLGNKLLQLYKNSSLCTCKNKFTPHTTENICLFYSVETFTLALVLMLWRTSFA